MHRARDLLVRQRTQLINAISAFRSGREFAAWLGLTPTQKPTRGKQHFARICRKGDQYIRRLLIIGAQTVLLRSKAAKPDTWIRIFSPDAYT